MSSNILKKLLYLILPIILLNCSNKEDLKIGKETAKFLYEKAMSEANKKEYENANEIFETILTDHPYSIWATKSNL